MRSATVWIHLSIVTFFVTMVGCAALYQELEPRPGYVPVYIREGDTPLRDIHPQLAEAFGELELKKSNKEPNHKLEEAKI